jgi:hypothetical protein
MEDEEQSNLEKNARIFKETLVRGIKHSIQNKVEFAYLKETCKQNDCDFDEQLINFSLDNYNYLIKEKMDKYKAKYIALWNSCYFIFNYKCKNNDY